MVPNVVTCDFCGATAVVIAWQPIFDDAREVISRVNPAGPVEISCKIDCPNCGNRTQVVRAKPTEQPDKT